DLEAVSQRLVQLSKAQGSTDNISVIVVFLTEPVQLASRPVDVWASLSKKQAPSNTMDTSNNPFATDSVPYQKAGLLLDLGGAGDVFKQNGTSPSANDLYFLDRPSNGKGNFDDDDFGPETDVDAVDDVLLSPAKAASPRNNNPFEENNENDKAALDADLELQRQQLMPGVTNLVPESDNVAESGEDSDDEWNYYRVEPSAETNQQSSQKVCDKPAQQQSEVDDEADMESQLNPDAAEFVPSPPPQLMPKVEDILLAESPKKGIPMENIAVPTHLEFQTEISQRPSELNRSDDIELIAQQKMAVKLPDLISTEGGDGNPFLPPGAICGKSLSHLENGGAFKDFLEQGDRNFQELQANLHAADGLIMDDSEVSSTKAEFGDDSTMSFMTSDLQKTVTESVSSLSTLEKSFVEQDMLGTELTSEMSSSDMNELSEFNENEQFFKDSVTEDTLEKQGDIENAGDALPMSFELQKELVPEMESKPERVQLESEGTSSFEQDESSSPIHTGNSQEPLPNLQAPDAETTLTDLQEEEPKTDLQVPIVDLISDIEEPVTESGVPDLEMQVKNMPDLEASHLEEFIPENRPVTPKAGDDLFETGGISPVPGLPELDDGLSPISSKSLQSPPMSPVLSNKSLQSPPLSPLAAKPELSLELSNELESSPKSPALSEKLQSPTKSPLSPKALESSLFEMPEKSPLSPPKTPLSEASSPIAGAIESGLSTPETVPVGKDTHSPSPVIESKSPIDEFCGLTDEISEDKLKLDKVVPENDLSQNSEFDIADLRHPLNRCQFPIQANNFEVQAISEDLVKPLPEISVTQTPPPTPAHVCEDLLASQLKENDLSEKQDLTTEKDVPIIEKVDLETEKEDVKDIEVAVGTATVAAAAVAATAVAAGVAITSEEKPEAKKPAAAAAADGKKPIAANKDKKGPIPEKTKTAARTSITKTSTTAAKPKAPVTSPTKPATTAARTSTPKKPTTTTTTTANKVTKSPSTTTAKPKAATPGTKTPSTPTPRALPTTPKPAAPSPRTRPVNTTTTTTSKSAVLTNGDAAKTGIAKKPASTTAANKPPSRPATAPAATKSTTTKQLSSTTSRTTTISAAPRPKPGAVNGTAAKPRTTGTVATATARSKVTATRDAKLVTEKQVKETANKQISSSRTVTATKSATTTATKRVTGVTKTSVSATNTIKSAPTKTVTKKATTTASSKTTTKTAVSVTATESNELVKVQQVTATVD
ncbi:hypothetical protein C0J52_24137, partial [Blattella germanica]